MAGGGDIIQNIVLAGQDDVIAGLNSIGSAGVQAFSTLAAAATNLNLSGPLGAIAGFTAAIATVTAGFFEWSAASSNATIRTANFGDELGTSAQQMTTLITALAQGGNQVTDLTTSFRRLAVSVESEWPTIQKSVRNAANLMKEDYIKIGEAQVQVQFSGEKLAEQQQRDALDVQKAQLGVVEAKQNLVKTDSAVALQMQANAVDVLSAEGQLSAALFALDHARRPATKDEKANQAEQQAGIAALQAQITLERAIKQQQQEQVDAAIKHRQAVLQVAEAQERVRAAQTKAAEDAQLAPLKQQQAELALAKARSEEREHQANDIANLKKYVDNLASGASNADSKVQLSSANLVKGLIASVGPGVEAVGEFKGSLGDLSLQAPKLYDVMLKVADIFHHTTDETLRAAIATALFGRGYSFSLVEALSAGSEAIKASQEKIAATFDLTKERVEEQVRVAREFRAALNSLGEGIKLVSAQISTIISPIFSTILRQLESAVEANRTKFLEWAQAIRDNLTPAITGFVSSLTGVNLSNAFNLSPEQILKAAEWKQTADNIKNGVVTAFNGVKDFLTTTLPAAFTIVKGVFDGIASVINAFGGNVSGAEVAIALLIGQFTGLNGAIIGVAIALGGLALALAANPFGLIAIAVVGSAAALTTLGVLIYKNRDAINEWLDLKVAGAFNWIADAFEDVTTRIRRELSAIDKDIKDMLLFKSLSTRQAENADIQKKQAQEDTDTQSRRQQRDASLKGYDDSAGLGGVNASAAKAFTAEDAFKSLGTTIESAMDKAKKAMGGLGDQSKDTSDKAVKAARDITDQGRSTEQAIQKVIATKRTATQSSSSGTEGNLNPDSEKVLQAIQAASGVRNIVPGQPIPPEPYGPPAPSTKEGFQADLDKSIEDLKDDWKSQRELNAQLHRQGTDASPQARTPAGVSQTYPPPVRGHYDKNYNFVPDVPVYSDSNNGGSAGPGVSGTSIPASNNYDFAGRRNPAGPYQEGISAPVTFPNYNKDQLENLPSQYPNGVPLPQPRPPEADQPSQPQTQQQQPIPGLDNLGTQLKDFVSSLTDALPNLSNKQSDQTGSADTGTSGVKEAGQQLTTTLQELATAVSQAAQSIAAAAQSALAGQADISEAPGHAEGGKIGGKPGRDSNLIWATQGEFMIRKDAVDHYGESHMQAINQKRAPKYWFGGMIANAARSMNHGMIPKYESGGPVAFSQTGGNSASGSGPMAEIHLHAPDGRTVGKGLGDRDLAEGLQRFATAGTRFSTGQAQTWRK